MFASIKTLISKWLRPKTSESKNKSVTQSETSTNSIEQDDSLSPNKQLNQHDEVIHFSDLVPYDENLLERSRTQWQFGDWERLAALNRETLQHHPDRAKLALLAAAGKMQKNQMSDARRMIQLGREWGASKKIISQILIAGVHNSIGRAAAIAMSEERALWHFQNSIKIGSPGADEKLIARARSNLQIDQLGLMQNGAIVKGETKKKESEHGLNLASENKKNINDEAFSSFSSSQYWEDRYSKGGNSGPGSYGRLADFKALVINKFIRDESIENVIEFGCGDGNQLALLQINNYLGIDVSPSIVDKCKETFKYDASKSFSTNADFLAKPLKSQLTLSLDVIFHLIEDEIFENYMEMLFDSAERYCIIYACDEDWLESDALHVRRRKFTCWISKKLKDWRLTQITYNKYPHDGSRNPKDLSFSNFYFYERIL